MTECVEQWICIKFCVKPENFSVETIGKIRKATAMGNWWLAASSRQYNHSCITASAEFLAKYWITWVTQPHYSPDLVPCDFWLLPKLKSPLKGKIFQTVRFGKIWQGRWWQLGELCEVPRCLLWRGLRYHFPTYNVSCIFFNKYLFFILHGWIPLYRPHICFCSNKAGDWLLTVAENWFILGHFPVFAQSASSAFTTISCTCCAPAAVFT